MSTVCMEKTGFEIIDSTKEEISILNSIDDYYVKYSEMSQHDRDFFNSVLLRKKPKKILEIGVAKGASSVIILNAIKDIESAHLYSCDYSEDCYNLSGKKTGFVVDNYPDLAEKQTLYTGGLTSDFIDEIGGDIDLCFIDTMHVCPGEILDFLLIYPYLKPDATIILHDINLQMVKSNYPNFHATNILFSVLSGKKLLPPLVSHESSLVTDKLPNIGAIELNSDINILDLFTVLGIRWSYRLKSEEIKNIKKHFARFYDEYLLKYFDEILLYQDFALSHDSVEKNFFKDLLKTIFSVRNGVKSDENYKQKIITFLGIKVSIKLKR